MIAKIDDALSGSRNLKKKRVTTVITSTVFITRVTTFITTITSNIYSSITTLSATITQVVMSATLTTAETTSLTTQRSSAVTIMVSITSAKSTLQVRLLVSSFNADVIRNNTRQSPDPTHRPVRYGSAPASQGPLSESCLSRGKHCKENHSIFEPLKVCKS